MNPEITLEQNNQLKTWVTERDAILNEIAVARTTLEQLIWKNKELGESNKEIEIKVFQSQGRLDEMDKKEEEYKSVLGVEVSSLEIVKTQLETNLTNLKKEIDVLLQRKSSLIETISSLTDVHDKVFAHATEINKTVNNTVQSNSQSMNELSTFVGSIKGSIQEIIDLNAKNVQIANQIANELPRVFLDVQRKSLEKHTPVKKIIGTP